MKIGIDFDRVLFKTDKFNQYLKDEAGLEHVDADVYDENGNYSPKKHAEALDIDIENVYKVINELDDFLYDDIEMLEDVDMHDFVIVTRGEDRFQRAKIDASGADKFFNDVFTVQNGSKAVDGIDFLVDDREEEIEKANVPGMVFDRERHTMEHLIKMIGGDE